MTMMGFDVCSAHLAMGRLRAFHDTIVVYDLCISAGQGVSCFCTSLGVTPHVIICISILAGSTDFDRASMIRMEFSCRPSFQYEIHSMLRRHYRYTLQTENAEG